MKIKKIKALLLICVVCVFSLGLVVQKAFAGKAVLTWTAPTINSDGSALTDLGGYKVYWGSSSGDHSNSQDVGNVTTYTINSIADTGTTYFSVTAYDTASPINESGFSSEVKKTPGDIDKNGSVNMFDFGSLVANYNYNNSSECSNVADINVDCAVNMLDFGALVGNYGITGQ